VENQTQAFEINLDLFDGPLDLLLHLVKQRELPLEKVSLSLVTEQYLGALRSLRGYDIDIASEYLVIAATLLSLKGSILLNEPVELVPDEDGNLVDPHDELLARLKEAQIYLEQAHNLAIRPMLDIDVFEPQGKLDKIPAGPITFKAHNAFTLGEAFRKVIKAAASAMRYTVRLEMVSVVQRMMHVVDSLKSFGGRLCFKNLLSGVDSKAGLAATFIALLELCKRSMIDLEQTDLNGELHISLRQENNRQGSEAVAPALDSEFDHSTAADQQFANS